MLFLFNFFFQLFFLLLLPLYISLFFCQLFFLIGVFFHFFLCLSLLFLDLFITFDDSPLINSWVNINKGMFSQFRHFIVIKINNQSLKISRLVKLYYDLIWLLKPNNFVDPILLENLQNLIVTHFTHLVTLLYRHQTLFMYFIYLNQTFLLPMLPVLLFGPDKPSLNKAEWSPSKIGNSMFR